ncbi:MAG: PSD1 and planctomycete cytochrome C domain-containing protein [Bacteroidota bacterium]|nr:PSD1 and planctomycete cytochrome C domain-containing protein [Bacteroidota bacterium]MDP4251947.1 PSD1 and planctomycete cytochrome C domain-containing protein [Bacteroidota bacterium]
MRKLILFLLLSVSAAVFLVQSCRNASGASLEKSSEISYNFKVRPILSDKCYACHGPDANKRKAGLRLDIEAEAYKALKDNPKAHALVPGDPFHSELYLRISSKDTSELMPPPSSNLSLTPEEIEILKKWISQGARYEKHWAFTPPVQAPLPKIEDKGWAKNEIDYFILNKLQQKGLKPNEEADKERLLKRISFDITGLPPSIGMMDSFQLDNSPHAYEKMIDRLLQSPAYGEKMAVHWMDVARYADSHGYQDDNYRSQWPWRDWVIHAFNENMPYDTFVTWQLAGDLLPNPTKEQLLATGFNRNHKITEEGGVIDEEYRVEYVTDRTNTFGRAFVGVTLECAHCHDHKYDPFSQREYYQMFAFFNNVNEKGLESTVGGPDTYAKNPKMQITNDDVKGVLSFINKPDTNNLIVSIMGDSSKVRTTYILKRGVYDNHGDSVVAGTPKAILPFGDYPKNRLGLAEWLFDKRNPLAARVYVNQIWQELFGRGIVKTASNFGMQGELPTNPELLDWLAVDFVNHGWDIKYLVKKIMMSATYRQSAVISPEKLKADPENIYLDRGPRFRLPAEFIRDMVLASSGLLVKTIGGPSLKIYQPAGLWEASTSGRGTLATYKQDHGDSLYRRGLYTFIKRTLPPPSMILFDASNRDQCEVKRSNTNTPLQALVMMNDPTVLEASRVLAVKLVKEPSKPEDKIIKAFRLIVCRRPTIQEQKILDDYYTGQVQIFSNEKQNARKLLSVGEFPVNDKVNRISAAAMMQVITTIYNLDETITKS